MKKKLLSILVATTLLLMCIPFGVISVSAATTGTYGPLTYRISNNTVTITACSTTATGELIIPDTIEGYPVTTISGYSFEHSRISSVTIPNSVTSIGTRAFYFSSVKTVNFGKGVTTIGSYALCECRSLKTVILPVSIASIEKYAFCFCAELTDVYYGGTLRERKMIQIDDYNTDITQTTWHYADDPISDDVAHSVMDTTNGNGLAFRFELSAKGVVRDAGNVMNLSNATIDYWGKECKLISMGTVVTNNSTVAEKLTLDTVNNYDVVNIPTVYLQEADEDSCAFAARIINIPDNQLERTIYARPYFIVEVDGEQITVYGEVDSATCAEYL